LWVMFTYISGAVLCSALADHAGVDFGRFGRLMAG
jgi:hypothetical protein